MIPRWHAVWGIIFSLLLLKISDINLFYILLIFLSSVLIDFDHYMIFVLKTGRLGLFKSFKWHEKELLKEIKERNKGIIKKGHFHLFHTIEFHVLVYLLSYLWTGFFWVFVGMMFHSLCDFVWLACRKRLYRREYFLVNWIFNKIKNNYSIMQNARLGVFTIG